METELKVIDDRDAELWDKIVESSSHGTIFHTWKYLKIVEKHTGAKLYPLMGVKESTVIGIFPVFYQKNYGIKMVMSPPPKTSIPYLGPIIVDYDKFKQSKRESIYTNFIKVVEDFVSLNLKPNYTYVALIPSLDPRPFIWAHYETHAYFDYKIDLSKGEESVWQSMDKAARDHIKKANKEGIQFNDGSKEELKYVYNSLVSRYMEQNRYENMPQDYLFEVFDTFYPHNLKVFTARSGEETVGGIVSLLFKGNIYFWIGATKSELKNASPNDLIHWEAMKWACNNGFKIYEETGANQERLCRFKSKYNPELTTRFAATKYSSFLIVLAEKGYRNVLKKLIGRLKG